MIPIKKEAVLVTPEDVKSSSSKFEVIGTFNPGAARMPNGDIALYVRVAEKLKNCGAPARQIRTNYYCHPHSLQLLHPSKRGI